MGGTIPGSVPAKGKRFFIFSKTPRPAVGPVPPSIHWVPEVLSRGVQWPGREVGHLRLSAEVKNAWSYALVPLV
jgi:hypothetical protein